MRIGLFSDTYEPDINGVVTSVLTLKNALEEAGHTVFVIANQPTLLTTSMEDGVLRLPGIELKFLYGYTMSSPVQTTAMQAVKEMKLDVIHIHSEFGVGLFGRSVAKNLQIPMVTTYHTQYEDYTHYVNFLGFKAIDQLSRKAVASLSRAYSKNVQVIIAPSEKTKLMLMRYEIRKEIVVIPTGLDLKRFEKRDEKRIKEIRSQYNFEDKFLITYIGRIAKEKSVDIVLEGMSKLIKINPNTHLMIVGGGPAVDELKEMTAKLGLNNYVTFTGPVPSVEVPAHYHASDAFISASLTETQGLTYIEALACGLCVFARPDRPLDGIVVDGKTGYLFSSPDEFATKAAAYIDVKDKSTMIHDALEVAKRFDSREFATNVLRVYQRAIDSYYGKYTVETVEEHDDNVVIRVTQGGLSEQLVIEEFIATRRGVEVGMEISRNEISSMENDQMTYQAYQLSLSRIGMRDYTSFEMSEYLRSKMDLTQEQIETVIELLIRRRFINDDRYFNDKIMYHREQLRGNQWIIDDLSRRGFTSMEISDELSKEPSEDYLERGLERANRFMVTQKDGSRLQRNLKLKQHLQRQGYGSDIIKQIMQSVEDSYELDDERRSLEKVITKALIKYLRRYDEKEARERTIKHAMSRGYQYEMVKEVLEEVENED